MDSATIVLAGATGNLGRRIARSLVERRAGVKALVRRGAKVDELRKLGASIVEVDFGDGGSLRSACAGGACVVSALSGLREVIVEAQTRLLDAAVEAGVPRFIPSDYSIDFTRLPDGTNRNLDLRREFRHEHASDGGIFVESFVEDVLKAGFAELLTGQAPFLLFKLRRVLCWGSADQRMDFTTMDDTASFTAAAALDPSTPRVLRVAGDQVSARDLVTLASEVTGQRFRLLRPGGLGTLAVLINVARTMRPEPDALYPPWQGMQYMHNMYGGLARLEPLDNGRYPGPRWTTVREVLVAARSHGA